MRGIVELHIAVGIESAGITGIRAFRRIRGSHRAAIDIAADLYTLAAGVFQYPGALIIGPGKAEWNIVRQRSSTCKRGSADARQKCKDSASHVKTFP